MARLHHSRPLFGAQESPHRSLRLELQPGDLLPHRSCCKGLGELRPRWRIRDSHTQESQRRGLPRMRLWSLNGFSTRYHSDAVVAFFPALPEFAWMIVYDYFALLEGRKAIILRLQKTLMQHRVLLRQVASLSERWHFPTFFGLQICSDPNKIGVVKTCD